MNKILSLLIICFFYPCFMDGVLAKSDNFSEDSTYYLAPSSNFNRINNMVEPGVGLKKMLSDNDIRFFANYIADIYQLGKVKKIKRIKDNVIYIKTPEGNFNIKLSSYRKHEFEKDIEEDFITHLNTHRIESPRLLIKPNNNLLTEINGCHFCVYEFIEGDTLDWKDDVDDTLLDEAAKFLASFHSVASVYFHTLDVPDLFDYELNLPVILTKKPHKAKEKLRKINDSISKIDVKQQSPREKLYANNSQYISSQLEIAIESLVQKETTGELNNMQKIFIHGDFHRKNMLFKKGEITGLLDFDRSRTELRLLEVMNSFSEIGRGEFSFERFVTFMKTYQKNVFHKLTDDEIFFLKEVVRIRILQSILNFMEEHPKGTSTELLQNKINNLKRLETHDWDSLSQSLQDIRENENKQLPFLKEIYQEYKMEPYFHHIPDLLETLNNDAEKESVLYSLEKVLRIFMSNQISLNFLLRHGLPSILTHGKGNAQSVVKALLIVESMAINESDFILFMKSIFPNIIDMSSDLMPSNKSLSILLQLIKYLEEKELHENIEQLVASYPFICNAIQTNQDMKSVKIMLANKILPTENLIRRLNASTDSQATIDTWLDIKSDIDHGRFDVDDTLHVEIGWTLYVNRFCSNKDYGEIRIFNREFYNKCIRSAKAGEDINSPQDADQAQLLQFGYSIFKTFEYIKEVVKKARELNKPVVLFVNESNGAYLINPIRNFYEDMGIKIVSLKVSSGKYHDYPYIFPNAETQGIDTESILQEKPIILIVDASKNIVDKGPLASDRGRYPDAYQGFRNFVWGLNTIFNLNLAKTFGASVGLPGVLSFKKFFFSAVNFIQSWKARISSSFFNYRMVFWTAGENALTIRNGGYILRSVTPFDPSLIQGNEVIFINGSMSDAHLPPQVKLFTDNAPHRALFMDEIEVRRRAITQITNYGIIKDLGFWDRYLKSAFLIWESLFTTASDSTIQDTDQIKVLNNDHGQRLSVLLKQTSEGLVLDIDGTIAKDELIDDAILRKIADLLNQGIPIAIITGRDKGFFKLQLTEKLAHLGADLKKLDIFLAWGSYGFNAASGPDRLLYENAISPTNQDLFKQKISQEFEGLFETLEVKEHRIKITTKNNKTRDEINIKLQRLLRDYPQYRIFIADNTIRIFPKESIKTHALEFFLKKWSLNKNNVIRIGDNGHSTGADHDILDHPSGISVGTFDRESDMISMVAGTSLYEELATKWLLQNLAFTAPLETKDELFQIAA